MRVEKFKIIEFIRQLILIVDTRLENFPKKEIEIKNRIKINSYDILELAYKANSMEDINEKIKLIFDILAKVKVMDFLLNLASDKNLISHKQYIKLATRLDDIARYSIGWINSLKSAKSKNN